MALSRYSIHKGSSSKGNCNSVNPNLTHKSELHGSFSTSSNNIFSTLTKSLERIKSTILFISKLPINTIRKASTRPSFKNVKFYQFAILDISSYFSFITVNMCFNLKRSFRQEVVITYITYGI